MNILNSVLNLLQEFVEHMNPQFIEDDTNDNTE